MNPNFKLMLCDVNPRVCEAWSHAFAEHPEIEMHYGKFQSVYGWDCVVSPANSFGIMDGGIDLHIIEYFGADMQDEIKNNIKVCWYGEQPLGTCKLFYSDTEKRWIAHTPTMRIPSDIRGTSNVYYAMKAMLSAVQYKNKKEDNLIHQVLCPGLGTYTGKMDPEIAAAQMELAYRHFKNPPTEIGWHHARKRDDEIRGVIE